MPSTTKTKKSAKQKDLPGSSQNHERQENQQQDESQQPNQDLPRSSQRHEIQEPNQHHEGKEEPNQHQDGSQQPNEDLPGSSQHHGQEPNQHQEEQQPNRDPDGTLTGYIHSVKNLMNANTPNKTQYFTCSFQINESVFRTLCYSPNKRKLFSEVQNSCTPVKISKTSDSRTGDKIVNRWSNVSLLKELPFAYDTSIAQDNFIKIAAVGRLATLEFVKVKAEIAKANDVIDVKGRDGLPLPKQVLTIRDETASCTVLLFGEYVNSLDVGKSYELLNLRLRKTGPDHFYLNTSEAEVFNFKQIDDLPNVVNLVEMDDVTMTGSIIGVSKIHQIFLCPICNKRADLKNDKVTCEPCKLYVARKFSECIWQLTLVFKSGKSTSKLFFNNDMTLKLAEIFGFMLTEEDIAQTVYNENLGEVEISFNKITNTVTNILPVD